MNQNETISMRIKAFLWLLLLLTCGACYRLPARKPLSVRLAYPACIQPITATVLEYSIFNPNNESIRFNTYRLGFYSLESLSAREEPRRMVISEPTSTLPGVIIIPPLSEIRLQDTTSWFRQFELKQGERYQAQFVDSGPLSKKDKLTLVQQVEPAILGVCE